MILETDASGATIREYVYLGDIPVAMIAGDKLYQDVDSSSETLVGDTPVRIEAESDVEATSLIAINGNSEISSRISDLSDNFGKESIGLTLREQQDGESGVKINVYFSALNERIFVLITTGDIFVPLFIDRTDDEALEIEATDAGGNVQFESLAQAGNWIKLERVDQFANLYTSVDGETWTLLRQYNRKRSFHDVLLSPDWSGYSDLQLNQRGPIHATDQTN